MKKRLISVLIVFALVLGMFYTVSAADEILVYFDGEQVVFDVDPIVIDGRTMVPMRAVFEAFGASVEYKSQTKEIVAAKGRLVIMLAIGNASATICTSSDIIGCELDVAPMVLDGRTLVPLRFIGEALGSLVEWNSVTRMITITSVDISLSASEAAKLLESKSVMIHCYDSSDNLVSTGSGFFISENGYIVTCYHVVEYTYKVVAVASSGVQYEVQDVIHADEDNDLIVLSINKTGCDPVEFGDSNAVETGNKIYAYSSPLGISNTLSEGIINNKKVFIEGSSYIQISAPISPGSSGGEVIDEYGEVIGIISSYLIGGQNMNLAIPVSVLKNLLLQEPLNLPFTDYMEEKDFMSFSLEKEPNNTVDEAQPIIEYLPITGTIDSFIDQDFYIFEITETKEIGIAAWWMNEEYEKSESYTMKLNFTLLNHFGNAVYTGTLFHVDADESDDFYVKRTIITLGPGTYYIRLNAFDDLAAQELTGEDYILYLFLFD